MFFILVFIVHGFTRMTSKQNEEISWNLYSVYCYFAFMKTNDAFLLDIKTIFVENLIL